MELTSTLIHPSINRRNCFGFCWKQLTPHWSLHQRITLLYASGVQSVFQATFILSTLSIDNLLPSFVSSNLPFSFDGKHTISIFYDYHLYHALLSLLYFWNRSDSATSYLVTFSTQFAWSTVSCDQNWHHLPARISPFVFHGLFTFHYSKRVQICVNYKVLYF